MFSSMIHSSTHCTAAKWPSSLSKCYISSIHLLMVVAEPRKAPHESLSILISNIDAVWSTYVCMYKGAHRDQNLVCQNESTRFRNYETPKLRDYETSRLRDSETSRPKKQVPQMHWLDGPPCVCMYNVYCIYFLITASVMWASWDIASTFYNLHPSSPSSVEKYPKLLLVSTCTVGT